MTQPLSHVNKNTKPACMWQSLQVTQQIHTASRTPTANTVTQPDTYIYAHHEQQYDQTTYTCTHPHPSPAGPNMLNFVIIVNSDYRMCFSDYLEPVHLAVALWKKVGANHSPRFQIYPLSCCF